jgi:hypothetical protein
MTKADGPDRGRYEGTCLLGSPERSPCFLSHPHYRAGASRHRANVFCSSFFLALHHAHPVAVVVASPLHAGQLDIERVWSYRDRQEASRGTQHIKRTASSRRDVSAGLELVMPGSACTQYYAQSGYAAMTLSGGKETESLPALQLTATLGDVLSLGMGGGARWSPSGRPCAHGIPVLSWGSLASQQTAAEHFSTADARHPRAGCHSTSAGLSGWGAHRRSWISCVTGHCGFGTAGFPARTSFRRSVLLRLLTTLHAQSATRSNRLPVRSVASRPRTW